MSAPPPIIQDMPPPGGYKPLNWKKTIRPRGTSGVAYFAGLIAWSIGGYFTFKLFRMYWKRSEFEMVESKIALEPFLRAENDRLLLKALWVNREEERELMKDDPDWIVGTWYGEKILNDNTRMIIPTYEELYAHCDPKEFRRRCTQRYRTKCFS